MGRQTAFGGPDEMVPPTGEADKQPLLLLGYRTFTMAARLVKYLVCASRRTCQRLTEDNRQKPHP
jgi:hypothetical protein